MSQTLSGRSALVTGASRGIGAAVAARLAAAGASVVVSARTESPGGRLPGSLSETIADIERAGGTARAVVADLSSAGDRARLADEAGPVDILVNNAAVTWFDPVLDITDKRIDLMLEVQLRAPIDLVRRLVPGMCARDAGWVLNVTSRAAAHPTGPPYSGPGATVYGLCKAGLERFTTGLAADLRGTGVAANALAPYDVVLTPGVVLHDLTEFPTEPVERFADAALLLCSGDPATQTGRVVTTRDI